MNERKLHGFLGGGNAGYAEILSALDETAECSNAASEAGLRREQPVFDRSR